MKFRHAKTGFKIKKNQLKWSRNSKKEQQNSWTYVYVSV